MYFMYSLAVIDLHGRFQMYCGILLDNGRFPFLELSVKMIPEKILTSYKLLCALFVLVVLAVYILH